METIWGTICLLTENSVTKKNMVAQFYSEGGETILFRITHFSRT